MALPCGDQQCSDRPRGRSASSGVEGIAACIDRGPKKHGKFALFVFIGNEWKPSIFHKMQKKITGFMQNNINNWFHAKQHFFFADFL